jgi:hypothetical protein
MVRGLYVPVDASQPIEVRDFAGLEDYQAAVEGWIEPVDVPDLGITIYVNEEGLLRRLPFNARASFLWWYHVPAARQAMLVGNAVIVGMPDQEGDSTDAPAEVRELFTTSEEFAVLVKVGGDPAWYTDPVNKVSSVVLPLTGGDPNWFASSARYEDYSSAAVWAMVLLERWNDAVDSKVVRVSELPDQLRSALAESVRGKQVGA